MLNAERLQLQGTLLKMMMNPIKEKPVSILFRFYSDLLEQDIEETMLAHCSDADLNYYMIDSIPVYTPSVATGDIVLAEYDDNAERLTYRETISASGNSVLWIVITDDAVDIQKVQEIFHSWDCDSVAISDRFFTMEIKAGVNYLRIRNKLNELKSAGSLDYEEACISEMHQY